MPDEDLYKYSQSETCQEKVLLTTRRAGRSHRLGKVL